MVMGPVVLSLKQRAAEKAGSLQAPVGQGSRLQPGELRLLISFSKEMKRSFPPTCHSSPGLSWQRLQGNWPFLMAKKSSAAPAPLPGFAAPAGSLSSPAAGDPGEGSGEM